MKTANLLSLCALALLSTACRAPRPGAPVEGPFAVVLGTAQDGGLPQLGCHRPCCERARSDPTRARRVASLALVDPASGRRWLIDATPDLPEQLALLDGLQASVGPASGRPPPWEAVALTHGHMGHYLGLAYLGREAYAAEGQRVLGSRSMLAALAANAPFRLAVEQGHLRLGELTVGEPVVLARERDGTPRLTLTALAAAHRNELTDTLAFRVDGPRRSLLYLPDIDAWRPGVSVGPLMANASAQDSEAAVLRGWIEGVDVALLDGTFFSLDELPDRSTDDIPHPPMAHTLELLADRPREWAERVLFTHLNHGNPAADPDGEQARAVRAAGAAVACDGQVIAL